MASRKAHKVAVLDIGSSKIVCFIAHIYSEDDIEIKGIGHQISRGIKNGIMIDVKQAEVAILAAIHAAEEMAGESIDSVWVNTNCKSLSSHYISMETDFSGQEISDEDLEDIIERGYAHLQSDQSDILHYAPLGYNLDGLSGIQDPRSMLGNRLTSHMHFVAQPSQITKNIMQCLAHCRMNIEGVIAGGYASALACLTDDEKELGTVLLDIGGGTTSLAIFEHGCLHYCGALGIGGNHITHDLARGLDISLSYAERMKNIYGSAIHSHTVEDEVTDIHLEEDQEEDHDEDHMEEPRQIARSQIIDIIQPRVEEILEMAKHNIEHTGRYMHDYRVVLTGGTSQLTGLKEVATHMYGKAARIGTPDELEGLAESTKGPAFSTPIGMLYYIAQAFEEDAQGRLRTKRDIGLSLKLNKLGQWFREMF